MNGKRTGERIGILSEWAASSSAIPDRYRSNSSLSAPELRSLPVVVGNDAAQFSFAPNFAFGHRYEVFIESAVDTRAAIADLSSSDNFGHAAMTFCKPCISWGPFGGESLSGVGSSMSGFDRWLASGQ
jgi:hypothetical protein